MSEILIANIFFFLSLAFILGAGSAHFSDYWFLINLFLVLLFYFRFRNLKLTLIFLLITFLGSFYFFLRQLTPKITFHIPSPIQNYRAFLEDQIKKNLPFPEENLFRGIFLGARFDNREVRQQFIDSGLIHITAVSGQNLTLMFSIFYEALKSFSILSVRLITPLSLVLIIFFVLLMGFEGNVLRAALMGFLLILAKNNFGRLILRRNILVFSLLIFTLAVPESIFEDVSTQLSFLAITGILYLAPVIESKLSFFSQFIFLRKTFSETLSAQIFTLPLILYRFGNINLLSLFANLLVMPLVPYLMAIASIFLFLPIKFLLFIALPLLNYVIFVAKIFSHSVLYYHLPLIVVLGMYSILLIEIYYLTRDEAIDSNFNLS